MVKLEGESLGDPPGETFSLDALQALRVGCCLLDSLRWLKPAPDYRYARKLLDKLPPAPKGAKGSV